MLRKEWPTNYTFHSFVNLQKLYTTAVVIVRTHGKKTYVNVLAGSKQIHVQYTVYTHIHDIANANNRTPPSLLILQMCHGPYINPLFNQTVQVKYYPPTLTSEAASFKPS